VLDLERAYVGGGKRGFFGRLDPQALARILQPALVDVAIARP
jgi:prolyl-tRNA editing enzyme YbaK/EbsC (Cys-tRNA(Pro) deacylase)